jgi:hypothetical protein
MSAEIPGSVSLREQLGIEQEDPKIFKPITLEESMEAAKVVAADTTIDDDLRPCIEIGIILDLMPAHLTPRKERIARAMNISARTVRRRELDWELLDPLQRFDLVRNALRVVITGRARKAWIGN